ncbi:MAG: hypothetical protein AB7S78_13840 [Candidatus Omnitrophota bacterium]
MNGSLCMNVNKILMQTTTMVLAGILCSGGLTPRHVFAAVDEKKKKEAQEVVEQYLKEKTKISGSLDLYDGSIDKVRNLKLMGLILDSLMSVDGQYTLESDFRDLNSGDIVSLKITLAEEKRKLSVKEAMITGVKEKAEQKDPEAANKIFTHEEALIAMKNYIEKMSKFGGTFGLFDPANEKYRQLKLIKIDEKIRNFGILYISTVDFEDVDTKEKVIVDLTVYNKEGELDIKSLRIKKIIKP